MTRRYPFQLQNSTHLNTNGPIKSPLPLFAFHLNKHALWFRVPIKIFHMETNWQPCPESWLLGVYFWTPLPRLLDSYNRLSSHLHLAKNLSTKCQRIVDEVSAKDFSLPAKFFLPKKNFKFYFNFFCETHFFCNF